MPFYKIVVIIFLLTFLAGNFTLNIYGLSVGVKVILFVLFVLALLVFLGLKNNISSRGEGMKSLIPLVLSVVFYMFLSTISLFYFDNPLYSLDKYADLIFLVLLVMGTVYLVSRTNCFNFFELISVFFISIGIIYALPISLSVIFGAERGDVLLSGPNVTTRILFFALCSSLYRYDLYRKNRYLIVSLLFLASIVLVGSRGGLFGAFIIIALLLFIKLFFYNKSKKPAMFSLKNILFLPIIVATICFLYNPVKKVFLNRILNVSLTSDDERIYTAGRGKMYERAIEMIREKPFTGHGVDAFTIHTGYVYPHNLLLEMLVEVGLLGGIVFIVFLYYASKCMFKLKSTPYFTFSVLPSYMIVVQMLSGEFFDFRYYFLWVIPLLYYKLEDFSGMLNRNKLIHKDKHSESGVVS